MSYELSRSINRFTILIFLIFISCKGNNTYKPADLVLVSQDELVALSQKMKFPDLRKLLIRNESGLVLDFDSLVLSEDSWFNFYKDNTGVIQEAILVLEPDEYDIATREKVIAAMKKGPVLDPIITDCTLIKKTLEELHTKDQNNRASGGVNDMNVDIENLQVLMGIIENCDVMNNPELSHLEYETLWLVLQHSPHGYMKKYFPVLISLADEGKINSRKIAMMQDRILIGDGKKQVYGTQVVMNSKTQQYELLPLESPELVNARRASVGLGKIQSYLLNWGIDFDIPQK